MHNTEDQDASSRAGYCANLAPELRRALRLLFFLCLDRKLLFSEFARGLFGSELRVLFCELFVFQIADFGEGFDYLILQRRVFLKELDLSFLSIDKNAGGLNFVDRLL